MNERMNWRVYGLIDEHMKECIKEQKHVLTHILKHMSIKLTHNYET
jgi:hypothetical protein